MTIDEVGGSALYLLSDLSAGVTGEIHYVDSGYHIVSMPALEELRRADEAARLAVPDRGTAKIEWVSGNRF